MKSNLVFATLFLLSLNMIPFVMGGADNRLAQILVDIDPDNTQVLDKQKYKALLVEYIIGAQAFADKSEEVKKVFAKLLVEYVDEHGQEQNPISQIIEELADNKVMDFVQRRFQELLEQAKNYKEDERQEDAKDL